jgi:hypothetical protein
MVIPDEMVGAASPVLALHGIMTTLRWLKFAKPDQRKTLETLDSLHFRGPSAGGGSFSNPSAPAHFSL